MLTYQTFAFSELSLDQLYEIMALRQAVFVVEQNCPYLDADGKDQLAYHVMGIDDDGHLQAYTRLLDRGISYPAYPSIGRVLNAQAVRGQGEGKRLMQYSIDEIYRLFGHQSIKISAQTYLKKFYQDLGFVGTEEEYLEDGIPHIAMLHQMA